jgi:predicted nuclease of predicted toxin-antitoxin system
MRFHLDEHVADAVAKGLRQRGIDVTTTSEANLLDAEDERHIAHALASGRVIVTQDADFCDSILKASPTQESFTLSRARVRLAKLLGTLL